MDQLTGWGHVVTLASLTLLAVSLIAAGDEVPSEPLQVSVVAVQAKNEGRSSKHFGPGLEQVRRAVSGLDYDSFYKVRSADVPVPYGEEAKIYIDAQYTLYVTPLSVTQDKRIRIKARITMKSKAKTVKALDTTLTMKPGSHLNLGGLRLSSGELIVVISVKSGKS